MKRSVLLLAAIIVAGCGGSSSNGRSTHPLQAAFGFEEGEERLELVLDNTSLAQGGTQGFLAYMESDAAEPAFATVSNLKYDGSNVSFRVTNEEDPADAIDFAGTVDSAGLAGDWTDAGAASKRRNVNAGNLPPNIPKKGLFETDADYIGTFQGDHRQLVTEPGKPSRFVTTQIRLVINKVEKTDFWNGQAKDLSGNVTFTREGTVNSYPISGLLFNGWDGHFSYVGTDGKRNTLTAKFYSDSGNVWAEYLNRMVSLKKLAN